MEFGAAGWRVVTVDRSICPSSHPARPVFHRSFSVDVGDGEAFSRILQEVRPELCVHLAGPSSVPKSFESPLEDFEGQVPATFRLLDAVRRYCSSVRVLIVSSAAVYGDPSELPIQENSPLRPISPYGYHKIQQEQTADEFHKLFGVAVCKARVFSTYGAGLRQLAVWDIATRAMAGSYELRGAGDESRDYLHARDVAAALEHLGRKATFAGEVVNVASGRETRIRDLARLIYRTLGTDREPAFHEGREAGKPSRWCAHVARLASLSFRPRVALEDGLRETIEWIRQNA